MFLASQLNILQLIRERRLGDIYYHRPFSLERPAFRLLRLERGTTLPIRCSIFEAYLDEPDTLIDYEALSYAWGSNDKSEVIIAEGRVLPVTESLHMALQHLRQEDIDRILWVDAICINQSNVAERGHQVTSMGSIYERATNVIIWLGSVSESAGLLISALNKLQHQVSSQAFRTSKRTDTDWREVWDKIKGKQPAGRSFLSLGLGLEDLTTKPWFTRVWILQEVAKARRAQIHCTVGTLDAKLFALAPWLLRTEVSQQSQAVLDVMPGPSRQSSWWSEERALWALLWRFRHCEATDPRDRVYALLGIASNMAKESITPDYSKSEYEVLRDVCSHLFGEESPTGLTRIHKISQLQKELRDLSIEVLKQMTARGTSLDDLERSLHRQGHIRWAEGIREIASSGLGSSVLSFLLTTMDLPLTIALGLFHEAIGMREGALGFLLDEAAVARTRATGLVLMAIRAGRDTLYLVSRNRGPEFEVCKSILVEAVHAGEDCLNVIIDKSRPQLELLESFLYTSIPGGIETWEEIPLSDDGNLNERFVSLAVPPPNLRTSSSSIKGLSRLLRIFTPRLSSLT
ncbi:hypothetical protein FALCPG4_000095 [Fusarium falciforme]